MTSLPKPSPVLLEHAQALTDVVAAIIAEQGPLAFESYMQLCLYHHQYGYYRSRNLPMGKGGDFITAPEISPYFAQCLAKQCSQVMERLGHGSVCEFGAGSGRMAADMLCYWQQHDKLPEHYFILEPCQNLREHQEKHLRDRCPELITDEAPLVQWIDTLPKLFSGVIVANEVLDAMPVQMIQFQQQWQEICVDYQENKLVYTNKPAETALAEHAQALGIPQIDGYTTEINRQGPAWLKSLAENLDSGIILLIDYGMTRHEYYHPQRHTGTLRCHLQHHVHNDPLLYPGGQDITAHVDFTTLAEAGMNAGLNLLGYCHQAGFLLGMGITELPEKTDDINEQLKQSQQIKQLTLPGSMGELFKAIAFGKNLDLPLQGFQLMDQRDRLFEH